MLPDPVLGLLEALIRAGLVLTDRDGDAAIAGADQGVTDKSLDRADQAFDIRLTLLEQIEELLGSVTRVGSDHRVHGALLRSASRLCAFGQSASTTIACRTKMMAARHPALRGPLLTRVSDHS